MGQKPLAVGPISRFVISGNPHAHTVTQRCHTGAAILLGDAPT
jgi:hypothetical protein